MAAKCAQKNSVAAAVTISPITKIALDCLNFAAVKGYPSFLISNIICIPLFLQIHGTVFLSVELTPSFYMKHRSAMIVPFMPASIWRLQLSVDAIFPELRRPGEFLIYRFLLPPYT